MDTLVRDILRQFQWPREETFCSQRPTYWVISRNLRVSPTAVKSRLDRLHEDGAIKGIRGVLDVSCLGLRKTLVMTQLEEGASERLKEKIDLLEFIEATLLGRAYYPASPLRFTSMVILHKERAELMQRIRLVREVIGDFPLTHLAPFRSSRTTESLPPTSGRVASELVKDPLIKLGDLSNRVRLSRKTVRKYLSILVGSGAFYLEPVLDSSRFEGALLFVVIGLIREDGRKDVEDDLEARLDRNYLLFERHYENVLISSCLCDNFEDMRTACKTILDISGLDHPTLLLPFETVSNPAVRYR